MAVYWVGHESNNKKLYKIVLIEKKKELILYTSPLYKYISFFYRQICSKDNILRYSDIKNFTIAVTIIIAPKVHLKF